MYTQAWILCSIFIPAAAGLLFLVLPAKKMEEKKMSRAAVAALAEVVGGSRGHRDDFALWGYLGFLDDACLRWVHAGCPDDQRHSLVDAALGCLEGALGDWRA